MQFNSLIFLLFFPVVCVIYYCLPFLKMRTAFLVFAGYVFYMSWGVQYGILLAFCTVFSYGLARCTEQLKNSTKAKQKMIMFISVFVLIGLLFYFKYFDFVVTEINKCFSVLDFPLSIPLPKILLPIGISFFTFQAVGYLIDVYRGKISAEKDFLTFALFLSFFPQLTAGPIERAENMLPQYHRKQKLKYENIVIGLKWMLWGYFIKLVVADRLAIYSNAVFDFPAAHNGSTLALAAFFFTIQIYADFLGYTAVALGCAKVLGFKLMENFNHPYFACSVTDFWRRWHISLSSWLRDYVYISLGGNRCSAIRHKINIILTFLISGIWHGANYTYIVWGFLHGVAQVFEKITGWASPSNTKIKSILKGTITFLFIVLTWIFFRANSLADAVLIIQKILNIGAWQMPFIDTFSTMAFCAVAVLLFITIEIISQFFAKWKQKMMNYFFVKISVYSFLLVWLLLAGVLDGGQFIYFKF